MKKIFLILAVLSSMHLFSNNNPDWTYQVCMGAEPTEVLKCVNQAIEVGFKPHYSLETFVSENKNRSKATVIYYQVIIKE